MDLEDLVAQLNALPVEQRLIVVESLLSSMEGALSRGSHEWVGVARERLHELRSGWVASVPGEQVFAKIWRERG